jgi:two-component system, cell cycle sensor histidine kinase and response regulator CckA
MQMTDLKTTFGDIHGRQHRTPAAAMPVIPLPATKKSECFSRANNAQSGNVTILASLGDAPRDSEARYRRMFKAAQDGILILDARTGLIIDVNPFLVKLLDYSRKEFLGKTLWKVGLFKDSEAFKAAFDELQGKRYVRLGDLPIKTKDGRSVNVELVGNVYGVNGRKVIQCHVRDITERKSAEQLERQLRQSQKMEAIGHLAGGMAHDFNNLLGIILGYCTMLEAQKELTEPIRRMIAEIHNAGTFAKNVTRDLLAFSRRQVLLPVFMDLNATVNRIDTMLDRLIGDDVKLMSRLASDLGTIKADPSQIEQVLMNLVINARDAMPVGGKITIETANIQIDDSYVRHHPSLEPGPYVVLSVSDTGVGMDQETQSHIFEPFFSTKGTSNGTGLGLSTVYGIVTQSGGTISVYSELDHGTTFKIHFPRHTETAAVMDRELELPLRGGSETILLVDDGAPLRELTKIFLEDYGYTVLDSGDPAEAIRIAGKHKGQLPLLITDVVMPGFSGPVLAERLAVTRPETRVLYTSGYADDQITRPSKGLPESAFLQKPFTRDALVKKVRELLDSPRTP